MGLDITHYKASLTTPNHAELWSQGVIIEENFENEGFNVPFSYFNNWIQKVNYPVVRLFKVILHKPSYMGDFLNSNYFTSDNLLPFTLEDDWQNRLIRYETWKGLESYQKVVRRSGKWTTVTYYETLSRNGFYYSEIGEQRKGMNANFMMRFGQEKSYNFALAEDFTYAMDCVDFYWSTDTQKDVAQRKRLFKENFVDQFEEGRSWLNVSY